MKPSVERAEQETILETYMQALGMLAGTPLGDAAVAAATRRPLSRRPASDVRVAG
jgi:hypothetical protein